MKKITFIIPARSREVCRDPDLMSKITVGTLQSIIHQTSDNWQCIVVCHENFYPIEHDNIKFVKAPHPVPVSYKERRLDKRLKLDVGVKALQEEPSEYVMFVDDDDRIHNSIVNYIETNQSHSGWYIDKGFEYTGGKFILKYETNFHQLCGSSIIFRSNYIFDGEKRVVIGHNKAKSYFEKIGNPLAKIPFYGTVRVSGLGTNLSGVKGIFYWNGLRRTVKRLLRIRIVNDNLLEKYSLVTYPLPR